MALPRPINPPVYNKTFPHTYPYPGPTNLLEIYGNMIHQTCEHYVTFDEFIVYALFPNVIGDTCGLNSTNRDRLTKRVLCILLIMS